MTLYIYIDPLEQRKCSTLNERCKPISPFVIKYDYSLLS